MKYWPVGLREHNGKWFSASLDGAGSPILEIGDGKNTPDEAVEQLRKELEAYKELEDWRAYKKARYHPL